MSYPAFTTLETPRLRLRRLQQGDAPRMLAYRQDPLVSRLQVWRETSLEALQSMIAAQEAQPGAVAGSSLRLGIERKQDGALLGDLALRLGLLDPLQAEIGYTLASAYHRQGYAREAAARLVAYAFEELGLLRLGAAAVADNLASLRVLAHLGFRREGIHRESFLGSQGWHADYTFGLLAREWHSGAAWGLPLDPPPSDGIVRLERLTMALAPALLAALDESRTALQRWLPYQGGMNSPAQVEYFITHSLLEWSDGGAYDFAIRNEASGELLGGCGLTQINRRHGLCNLYYWVRAGWMGKGTAGRAARLAAQFGLFVLGLQRIEALAALDNLPSQRAAEKAGFRREAVLDCRLAGPDGRNEPAVLYAFTHREISPA